MTRYARRVDSNHGLIRDGLRDEGWDVLDLSGAGDGIPDLCVRIAANRNGTGPASTPHFLEIKDGAKPLSAQKLTAAQEKWHSYCWAITSKVRSLEEAKAALAWAVNNARETA